MCVFIQRKMSHMKMKCITERSAVDVSTIKLYDLTAFRCVLYSHIVYIVLQPISKFLTMNDAKSNIRSINKEQLERKCFDQNELTSDNKNSGRFSFSVVRQVELNNFRKKKRFSLDSLSIVN